MAGYREREVQKLTKAVQEMPQLSWATFMGINKDVAAVFSINNGEFYIAVYCSDSDWDPNPFWGIAGDSPDLWYSGDEDFDSGRDIEDVLRYANDSYIEKEN